MVMEMLFLLYLLASFLFVSIHIYKSGLLYSIFFDLSKWIFMRFCIPKYSIIKISWSDAKLRTFDNHRKGWWTQEESCWYLNEAYIFFWLWKFSKFTFMVVHFYGGSLLWLCIFMVVHFYGCAFYGNVQLFLLTYVDPLFLS